MQLLVNLWQFSVAFGLAFQKHVFVWKPVETKPYKEVNSPVLCVYESACSRSEMFGNLCAHQERTDVPPTCRRGKVVTSDVTFGNSEVNKPVNTSARLLRAFLFLCVQLGQLTSC